MEEEGPLRQARQVQVSAGRQRARGRRWLPGASAAATFTLVAGGAGLFVTTQGADHLFGVSQQHRAGGQAPQGRVAGAATSAPAASTTTSTQPTTTTTPPEPRLVSTSPAAGAKAVPLTADLTLVLSRPLPAGSPMPSLVPAVAGKWSATATTLRFAPATTWAPWAAEQVVLPAGVTPPAHPVRFTVQGVSLLRAEQLLAELKYLPLRFGPSATTSSLASEATTAALVSPFARPGHFTWRYANIPPTLSALWSPGLANVVAQGAVMRFEDVSNLPVDGFVGPQVWQALTAAVAARRLDPGPYDYLMVDKALPESLVVWRNGQDIFKTPVNTGVQGAVTPDGTWPVFEHVATSRMVGTDPNGYHYDVPDVPWVAYFYEGDAVHGYPRATYGWPQSNGCVELPIANAQTVWPMDPLGTLVNVSG
jgi:hypothetical protein